MPVALVIALLLGAPEPLERARVCWAALDAECASAALAEARAGLAAMTADEQLEVLRLSAEVELSSDHPDAARPHIEAALARAPAWSPAWPAAWRAVLEDVREAMPDRLPPEVTLAPSAATAPKKPVLLVIGARDPSGVASVTVVIHDQTLTALTADGERWRVEVPATMVKIPDLLFDVVATDRAGNATTTHGRVEVAPPPVVKSPPVTSRWWFWTAIGAGAAALVVTTIILASDGDAVSASGGHGNVTIIGSGPGESP